MTITEIDRIRAKRNENQGSRSTVDFAIFAGSRVVCRHRCCRPSRSGGRFAPRVIWLLVLATLPFWGEAVTAQSRDRGQQNPLGGQSLQNQLRKRISVSWSEVPLRDTLLNLGRNQRIAIFVDRRVDPNQIVAFSEKNVPVGELLYLVADSVDCGVCWLGDVAYFGRQEEVARLIVLRERMMNELTGMSSGDRRRLLSPGRFDCERLSRPAELLISLLDQLGIESDKVDLPHDLWPAYRIPSVGGVDRLILLTYGFDRWIQFDGSHSVSLIEVPAIELAETKLGLGKARNSPLVSQLKSRFPDATIRVSRNSITCQTSPADLYRIRRTVKGFEYRGGESDDRNSQPEGTPVVSLRSTVQIGNVLKTAANRLSVDLEYDPSLREALIQRVNIDVTRVTYEQLVQEALSETDLVYELTDKVLRISKKQ